MVKLIKRALVSNPLRFILFEFLNKFIPFFSMPVLASLLTQYDFALAASLYTFVNFAAIFILFGANSYLVIKFRSLKDKELELLMANMLGLIILTTSFGFIVIIGVYLLDFGNFTILFLLTLLAFGFSKSISNLHSSYLIATKHAGQFGFFQTLVALTTFLPAVLMLKFINNNIVVFYSAIFTTCLINTAFLILIWFKKLDLSDIKLSQILLLTRFGGKLLPHSLAANGRNALDVLVLSYFFTFEQVSLYLVAIQFAAIPSLIAVSYNRYFSQLCYDSFTEAKNTFLTKVILARGIYGIILVIISALLIALSIQTLISYLYPGSYSDAGNIVKIMLWAPVFQSLYFLITPAFFYEERNNLISGISVSVFAIHALVILYSGTIQNFDIACSASVISWALQFTLVFLLRRSIINKKA